jgi:hypothetical protein
LARDPGPTIDSVGGAEGGRQVNGQARRGEHFFLDGVRCPEVAGERFLPI